MKDWKTNPLPHAFCTNNLFVSFFHEEGKAMRTCKELEGGGRFFEVNCWDAIEVLLSSLADQAVLYPLPFRKGSGLEAAWVSGYFSWRQPTPEEFPFSMHQEWWGLQGTCWFLYPWQCLCLALGMLGTGEGDRETGKAGQYWEPQKTMAQGLWLKFWSGNSQDWLVSISEMVCRLL